MTKRTLQALILAIAPILREFTATLSARLAALEAKERGLDGKEGPAGPPGPPGPPGRDGRDGLQGPMGEKGLDGRHGLDGAPGRDGLDGQDGRDGLGFDDLESVFSEERGWSLRFTRGDQVRDIPLYAPWDAGVWKPGRLYPKAAGVTHGGAWWIAQEDTYAKPGEATPASRAWRLAVKAGKDAVRHDG